MAKTSQLIAYVPKVRQSAWPAVACWGYTVEETSNLFLAKSSHRILRRNSGGYFQSQESLKLQLGLVVSSLEQQRWKSPDRSFSSALAQLNTMFQSRFETAR